MIPFYIKLTIERPPEASLRAWRRITKQAHAEQGKYWHANFLPLHFRRDSATRYKHQKRTAGYLKRKFKAARKGKVRYAGYVDNVYSGRMEEMLKSIGQVRAYPTRVRVTMTGPRYMTMRRFAGDRDRAVREGWKYGKAKTAFRNSGRGSGLQPDKPKELTAVTDEEEKKLSEVLHNTVLAGLEKVRSPKTIAFR